MKPGAAHIRNGHSGASARRHSHQHRGEWTAGSCALGGRIRPAAEYTVEVKPSLIEAASVFVGCNRHVSERQLVRSMHFDKIYRSAGSRARKCTLARPRHGAFREIGGWHADYGKLGRVCIDETWQPEGGGLEAMALHVVAFHPLHTAQIHAHCESRTEDLAQTDASIPTVVGVSLPRTGGVACAIERSFFVFVFLLVGITSIKTSPVAEVMVDAAAILVRIVC